MVIRRRGFFPNHTQQESQAAGRMKGLFVVLTLALIACDITPLCGFPLESFLINLGRCQCLREASMAVPIKDIKSIRLIPQGVHCRRTELILTLRSNHRVCVSPNAGWTKELLRRLTKR
ncbi:growth-regulated alpha protein-like [Hemicordylus capensis]|uniref:growth-regulated alpha protein-like n=1 Tax=Hemicordylus capensis TaxID=884348 RepID=UPI002303E0CE|nr:growth-regulated alpha protein-like [Hemicordylus capensis]